MERCGPTLRLVWRHPNSESIKTRSVICHLHEIRRGYRPTRHLHNLKQGFEFPVLAIDKPGDGGSGFTDHLGKLFLGKVFGDQPFRKCHNMQYALNATLPSNENFIRGNGASDGESGLVKSMSKPYRKLPSVGHPGHYIRDWRLHRTLTQEQLAERIEKSTTQVSKIENGRVSYTQATLEAFAYALNCEPGDLLKPPTQPKSEIEQLILKLDAKDQAKAIRIIKAMAEDEAA